MKKNLLSAAFLISSLCFGFSQSTFTLLSAITESLNSNYDIKKQQYAVANAESQLRQIKGNLDFEIRAVEAAKKKISISKAAALPDAKLKLNIGTTGSKYSDDVDDTLDSPFWNIKGVNWGGSVSVAIKPGNNTKRGVIDQNYAEYNTALNEYNKAVNVLATQIINVAESLEVYTKNVKNADEVLQLQSKMYENQEYLFSTGFINADKLIEQDQKYINAKQNYYKVLADYMGGVLQYKYLTAEMIDVTVDPQFSGV